MPFNSDKPNPGPGDMLEFLRPDQEDDAEGQMWFGGFTPVKLLYRRYTGHHPDVLMRAMELAVEYVSGNDRAAQAEVVQEFIADAEVEIAKEREA